MTMAQLEVPLHVPGLPGQMDPPGGSSCSQALQLLDRLLHPVPQLRPTPMEAGRKRVGVDMASR